ncbi:MAG: hypothetical protein J7J25_00590 [Candidatus Omnitrophica bacterium]|nr:hypothetical protein [Candidatus Omnitrophota bacterium]
MLHRFFLWAESLVKAKSFLAVFFAFSSGFLLSLTPCFLPLVPVMLGMLGFGGGKGKKETLFYLLFFALVLLGVFNLPFLDIKTKKHLSRGGAFVLGGAGALSAGGCTFPVLGSILVLAALQHDFVFSGVFPSFFIKENLLAWLIPWSYRR